MSVRIYLILFFLFGTSCESLRTRKEIYGAPVNEIIKSEQQAILLGGDEALNNEDYQEAENIFRSFIKDQGPSIYTLHALLGLGQALQGQGQWQEAIDTFEKVAAVRTHPHFAALALYQLSYCFEALGDDVRVLAALSDAENLGKDSDPGIFEAELMARRAAASYRLGDELRSTEYFRKADRAIARIYPSVEDPMQRTKKAKSYFWMGHAGLGAHQEQQVERTLKSLTALQMFSLRAIELDDKVWSRRALQDITGNYDSLILKLEGATEVKSSQVTGVLEALNRLKAYMVKGRTGEHLQKLSKYIMKAEARSHGLLSRLRSQTPLTKEAKERSAIKKPGTVYSAPYFSEEKAELKKLPESENKDPNL